MYFLRNPRDFKQIKTSLQLKWNSLFDCTKFCIVCRASGVQWSSLLILLVHWERVELWKAS